MKESLRATQLRLTASYVGVFAAVLLMFGAAVLAVVSQQMGRAIDRDLTAITDELVRAIRARESEHPTIQETVSTVLSGLRIPRRSFYVLDDTGGSLGPVTPPLWTAPTIQLALESDTTWGRTETGDERNWRLYARRFSTKRGNCIALAVADVVEVEEQYPELLTGFALAGLFALLLLGLGGAALARRSLVPIQDSMERMRRFVADASHELRTPATVLRTRAEVALQRERTPVEYVDTIAAMKDEAERLGSTVDGLLLLAAADEQRIGIRRESVYLDDLLIDAVTTLGPLASNKKINIDVIGLEEAPVSVDPPLVRQLFTILLENAMKYTPVGGRIELSSTVDRHTCRARIVDTGPGINSELLPYVFERFVRADSGRKREGGVGLGLSIAKAIIEAHDAHIDLQSTPGKGTAVTVAFPVRDER